MSAKKNKKTDGLFDGTVVDAGAQAEPHYEQPHVKGFDGASYEPEEDQAADAGVDVGTMEDVEAVMRKYDKESNTRIWEGRAKFVIDLIMAAFSLYCIWSTLWSNWGVEKRLTFFMGWAQQTSSPSPVRISSTRFPQISHLYKSSLSIFSPFKLLLSCFR